MNTIIRVIQSTLSVIIWSRAAALHRCHCCAVNASVITATANMAQSQKRLSGVRGEEIISATKTRQLLPKKNFSPRFLFIFLLFHLPSTRRRKKDKASKKPLPQSFLQLALCIYRSSFHYHFWYSLCIAQEEFSFCLARVQLQQLCCAPGVARG